jgi:dihydrodipicolinate synthase/N-acetylneuraminate lyase
MRGRTECDGVVVPMVTPCTAAGELDERAVHEIVDFLLEGKVDGIFILGTTGEGASVPFSMHAKFTGVVTDHVNGRARVYAGISDNCLSVSLDSAAASFHAGVDAVVAHPAFYYSLQPDELIAYFSALADGVKGPLLLYNIPATTHVSIPVGVIATLSERPNIIGLKDSENSPGRPEAILDAVGGKDGFSLFMGASVLSAKALALGMDGVVPSSGNLAPHLWHEMLCAAVRKDWAEVGRLQVKANRVAGVFQRNRTLGQSLAALKAAMSCLDLCEPNMLPPLHALTPDQIGCVAEEMRSMESEGLLRRAQQAAQG